MFSLNLCVILQPDNYFNTLLLVDFTKYFCIEWGSASSVLTVVLPKSKLSKLFDASHIRCRAQVWHTQRIFLITLALFRVDPT